MSMLLTKFEVAPRVAVHQLYLCGELAGCEVPAIWRKGKRGDAKLIAGAAFSKGDHHFS